MDSLCPVGLLLFALLFLSALAAFSSSSNPVDLEAWPNYATFERRFLFVFFLACFCEFIQGPYLFAVYADLHAQPEERIGILFLSGALANALTGCLLGPLSDAFDKRVNCAAFCFCSIGASFIAQTSGLPPEALFVGRLLGGAATASLETAFEALSVYEHRRRNFPECLLERLFALSSACSGVSAIVAGFAASCAVSLGGVGSPFAVACAASIFCLLFLATLFQNPSSSSEREKTKGGDKAKKSSFLKRIFTAPCKAVRVLGLEKEARLSAGLQITFEFPLELFVFLWAQQLEPGTDYGVAFAILTASLCSGSFLFLAALRRGVPLQRLIAFSFCAASVSFAVPCSVSNSAMHFSAFLLFELCAGVLLPALSIVRSHALPDDCRASAASLPRVFFNVVLLGALGSGAASLAKPAFFLGLCSLVAGALLSCIFCSLLDSTSPETKTLGARGGVCQ